MSMRFRTAAVPLPDNSLLADRRTSLLPASPEPRSRELRERRASSDWKAFRRSSRPRLLRRRLSASTEGLTLEAFMLDQCPKAGQGCCTIAHGRTVGVDLRCAVAHGFAT